MIKIGQIAYFARKTIKNWWSATSKALSPRVVSVLITLGASDNSLLDRRQYLLCDFVLIRLLIYPGDKPYIDLNIITNTLRIYDIYRICTVII